MNRNFGMNLQKSSWLKKKQIVTTQTPLSNIGPVGDQNIEYIYSLLSTLLIMHVLHVGLEKYQNSEEEGAQEQGTF